MKQLLLLTNLYYAFHLDLLASTTKIRSRTLITYCNKKDIIEVKSRNSYIRNLKDMI